MLLFRNKKRSSKFNCIYLYSFDKKESVQRINEFPKEVYVASTSTYSVILVSDSRAICYGKINV